MLSSKLRSLSKFLELVYAGKVQLKPSVIRLAAAMTQDAEEQARRLEEAVVPRRQRLTDDHIRSGKVHVLPLYPRDEAVLP